MNSVRAGSRPSQRVGDVGAVDVGDEMGCAGWAGAKGASARVAIAGPRSEPPMPMLTTSVIGWPSAPRTRPSRTSAAKASILAALGYDLGHDVRAVDQDRLAGEIAQRGVQRGAPSRSS